MREEPAPVQVLKPEPEQGLGLDEQHQQLAYLADELEEGPPPLT